jgi:hypothetical protein
MDISGVSLPFAVSYRENQRFAVISTFRLHSPGNQEITTTRIRKILRKNLGILVYRLPLSKDPTSLLYDQINSIADT